ncbi:MAG: FAD-dependent oxidoreductase [Candidatus Hodarchaeota archaeon]
MEKSENIVSLNFSSVDRAERLDQLKSETFDLLIIGGGMTGAGIARDAAFRGFKVALVDKNDFAFGTSSRSTKWAHGGFRYMLSAEFGLVHESETERNWLRNSFSNLVRPFHILIPSYEGSRLSPALLRVGIFLYDLLNFYKNYIRGKVVTKIDKIKELEPLLNTEGMRGCGITSDTNLDDARLTVETVKEAVNTGKCLALNHVKITHLEKDESSGKVTGAWAEDQAGNGKEFLVKASIVVNATGIWTDEILEKKPEGYPDKIIRPTKGVHLVFKREDFPVNNSIGLSSLVDRRFMFVYARGEYTMLGTTDTDYKEDFDIPVTTKDDAEYLIASVQPRFPEVELSLDKIVGTYAGVRPLAVGKTKKGEEVSESKVSRNHLIIQGDDDLVTICGGKLTTFRVMAQDVMMKHILKLAKEKIPGKTFISKKNITKTPYLVCIKKNFWKLEPLVKEFMAGSALTEDQLEHLYQQYGKGGIEILKTIKASPGSEKRLVEDEDVKHAPWIEAEIEYIVPRESPCHLVDLLARRMEATWMMHPSKQRKLAENAARIMGKLLKWDEKQEKEEIESYLKYVKSNSFFYDKPL